MYAVTIQVAQCKRIEDLPSKGRTFTYYQDAESCEQMRFIEKALMKWSFTKKVYEQTPSDPKKRLHLHGLIEFKHCNDIDLFKKDVYKMKTPNQSEEHLLKIECVFDWKGWHTYMDKQQPPDPLFESDESKGDNLKVNWKDYK